MSHEMKKLLGIVGKRNWTPEDSIFVEGAFSKRFLKKKNQIKRAVKQAKANVYGW